MKNVLVTGASSGIGLAICRELAREGSQLTLVARSVDKLQEIIAALPGTGHEYLQADLSSSDGIDAVTQHLSERNYDVLINNAGVGLYGRFEELPLEQQTNMLTLNINALLSLSHTFLKQARSGDTLVNIASVLGMTSLPGAAAYAGTKGFVIEFSESLWYEFKDRNIYVLALCPGITATNFHDASGGAEGGFPSIIVQTPEQVATETVRAIKARNRPVAISGFMSRMMVFSYRFLSRTRMVKMMGGFSPVKAVKS